MSFAKRITRVPFAFDVELGREAVDGFASQPPETRDLLLGTAGSSPYLRGLIAKHSQWLEEALASDLESTMSALLGEARALDDAHVGTGLRSIKGRAALLIALADLGGLWTLEEVTQALTDFADLAVDCALRSCIRAEIHRGKLSEIDAPAGGVVAIAMGKMGAGELNYSSDIDLIVLFDGAQYGEGVAEARSALVRAVRRASKALSDNTNDGYVFRTDLRLRPDPSVTPVVLSFDAAESYYESVGRTWERAAYIKARAAAGDVEAGNAFLERLTPFVWRRHLDFAAIQDAHEMRLRIRDHKGLFGPITLPRHNMKLGRGGIREIEFFTQTRQLIAGGRDPELRVSGTVDGLRALAAKDWVPNEAAESLTDAYRKHREVEHRLQMIADAQTHSLPGDDDGFARLAALMGRDSEELKKEVRARLEEVHTLTEEFFAPADTGGAKPEVDHRFQTVMDGWRSYPALRNERAVKIFDRIQHDLVAGLNRAAKPEEALEQFDLFLSRLPAGVQLFSLFEANPHLIELIVDVVSVAPALAHYLGRNAQVFDAVIGGEFFADWPGRDALESSLTDVLYVAGDYEGKLDAARRWHKEWHFRIGVHFLRGIATAKESGRQYAELAEATVACLWAEVVAEFARKYGAPPGRGGVILGMGSLGSGYLTATSDLDLIVIYDPEDVEYSDGDKQLHSRTYYARLTQAFVTAFSVQTAEGTLYEVDMRLRPSGRKGPVATSFASFKTYQREEAWTWESLALTRARVIAGNSALASEVEEERETILKLERDPAKIAADVAEMRNRLADAHGAPSEFDAKRGPGRMMEIELLGQALALIAGSIERVTDQQIVNGEAIGKLNEDQSAVLSQAHDWFWSVQAGFRLITGNVVRDADIGAGGWSFVSRVTGMTDSEALASEIRRRSCDVEAEVDAVLDTLRNKG